MTTNNGSPLQAIKFACHVNKQHSERMVVEFLRDWHDGFVSKIWSEEYTAFCDANPDEPTHVAADGTTRQAHYGSGRQPWDDIVERGWGPEMAAGNALKYVRRDSGMKGTARARDLKHARWYYARLVELGTTREPYSHHTPATRHALAVFADLNELLTPAERALLTA